MLLLFRGSCFLKQTVRQPKLAVVNAFSTLTSSESVNKTSVEVGVGTVLGQSITKIISASGVCSRREAEKWVRAKRVTVNGVVCPSSSAKYDLSVSQNKPNICVDGVTLKSKYKFETTRMWAVNKVSGEIVDTVDKAKQRALVLDRFKPILANDKHTSLDTLRPVYRLEYNSEGLCLFTNSGKLAQFLDGNQLNLPRHYRVRVNGVMSESKLLGLRRGMTVDGVKFKPMDVSVQNSSGTMSWVAVTCYENKNRIIQKAFKKMFLNITRLICVGFGPYKLSDCAPTPGSIVEIKLTPELNGKFLQSTIR